MNPPAPAFDAIGFRVYQNGWTYHCDGMPTLWGCGQEITITRRYRKCGKKSSGWFVCYGLNDDGSDDKDTVLIFCPTCARAVKG